MRILPEDIKLKIPSFCDEHNCEFKMRHTAVNSRSDMLFKIYILNCEYAVLSGIAWRT